MTKDETAMFWQGVSLGLGTAVVIAERGTTRHDIILAIRKQQREVDDRDRNRAAEAGLEEYNSWLRHLPADLEVASWNAHKFA